MIFFILLIFLIFLFKIFKKISYLKNDKIKLIIFGCSIIIFFQFLVHLGVNIRILPTTGMTLPFLSYGGSSIIGSSILAGIILNLTKKYILKEKILITTGGSGGHVLPALNFYEHLKENYQVFLITDLRGSRFINSEVYKYKIIDIPDIKKNFLKIPINLAILLISIIKSFIFLKKNKIDKVISTGGYMSFPVCLASRFTKSNLFLFEPNMVLGRSNLFFIKQCKKIFCYSKRLEKFPKLHTKKIKTIYPIINKKFYLSKNEGINNKDENILLVVGEVKGKLFSN